MKNRSFDPVHLCAEIALIIALCESLVMLAMPVLTPGLSLVGQTLVHVLLLILVAGPAVYWRCAINLNRLKTPAADTATSSKAPQKKTFSIGAAIGLTAAAQVLGLLGTVGLVLWLKHDLDKEAQVVFERGAERIESEVMRRFNQPLLGLKGARGAYAASTSLSRRQFQAYVESRDLATELPGIRGFGFVARVQRKDLAAFIAAERADFAPHFEVHTQGHADDLFVVKFLEPMANNHAAFGMDLGQEPVRREAAERAMNSGQPALSGKLTLVQDARKTPGLLYFLPVYRHDADPVTPQQHQAALVGLLYAPMAVGELLNGVPYIADNSIRVELWDGDVGDASALLYDSEGGTDDGSSTADADTAAPGGRLPWTQVHPLAVGGRVLQLRLRSNAFFNATQDRSVLALAAIAGTMASMLASLTVWLLALGRLRAQRLAERMTTDLDRLARVVQHTSNAVMIADPYMRISWVNAGFTRLTGYTLDESRGKTPGELLGSGKADPAVIARLASAVEHGEACRVEVLNRAKDGREYWVDTEVQPTRGQDGALVGFMEIGTDITVQKQAQKTLAEMSDRMTLAIEGGSDGLWDWMDMTSDAQWWSQKYYQLLGYTPEEMPPLASSFLALLHPDSLEPSAQATNDAVAGLRPYDLEVQLRTKDKGYRWFRTRAKVYSNTPGHPTRMAGATQDIHDQKMAQFEVQRADDLLRGSIDALDHAFVLFDPEDRLVICNQRYRDLYTLSADLIVAGNTFEAIVRGGAERGQYKDAVGRVDAWVAERLAIHRRADSNLLQTLEDGRTLKISERRMPSGHIVGYRVDITDLIQAKQAAEQASVSKSQFLANMSHEIRTPMNAILGMLKLLQSTDLTVQQLDYATKTEGAARSLLGLLNDILDFSKVEAGKMTLDPRPFRVDRLMRDLSVILSANMGAKPIEVLFDIDPAIPKCLLGDDMRLQQVLINLGGNAIKFTEEGEVVLRLQVVTLDEQDALIRFSVQDSGIGIAPENQARIFSGFSQAEASTTRRFGGTGLGLAISSRLVGLLGGTLAVDSSLGHGSCFHFEARFALAQMPEPDAPGPASPQGTLAVLVVDDNEMAREVFRKMLLPLGWQVDVADSGVQALELIEARASKGLKPFDAIFMDWQMPQMDGWEASMRIRKMDVGRSSPIVVMVTAHGREILSERKTNEQALINGYLVKPVTATMAFDAIQEARAAARAAALGLNPTAPKAAATTQRLTGMRLLVVEDNKINQQVARGLLGKEGAQVTLADDGKLGVAAVAAAQPLFDAVLMDVQMPVMDGYAATRAIRQELGLTDLPIIAMTANAMASDRAACLEAGMNDHIGKPFVLDELVALLQRLVDRPGI